MSNTTFKNIRSKIFSLANAMVKFAKTDLSVALKHAYSIYRKFKNLNLNDILEILAVEIKTVMTSYNLSLHNNNLTYANYIHKVIPSSVSRGTFRIVEKPKPKLSIINKLCSGIFRGTV
jgi:hypothetical protein